MWFDASTLAIQLLGMDQGRFVALCNDLLYAVADRHGIDRSHIITTERINDPDGGIDARCENAPEAAERLIPAENVIYQFKSGETRKSGMTLAKEDILEKPRVVSALQAGSTFVYLAAWDKHAGGFEEDIASAAGELGLEVRSDQIRFFGGASLAAILRPYVGLSRHFIGFPLKSLEDWARERNMSNRHASDEALRARMDALDAAISVPQARIRLVGRAGDGKTRTVLETLGSSDLRDSVLYASNPEELDLRTIEGLRHTESIRCTVVVDEVDDSEHERLMGHFDSMPPGVRLVTIGVDAREIPSDLSPSVLRVAGLSPAVLEEAMQAVAPGAPDEAIKDAVRACGGSPKLAILIAERMQADPTLVRGGRIAGDQQVKRVLDRYLGIALTDPAWTALSIAALLEKVGWARELEAESETLFRAAGLDPSDARRLIQDVHERLGVAPRTRRLLYISPTILADHLASRQLGSWTQSKLAEFYSALTGTMRESFARRLRRIASTLDNREAVEEVILGDQGPFRSLAEAEAGGMTGLLPHLAGPLRVAATSTLRRLVEDVPIEDLLGATRSRRDLVNALTELLWFGDTFEAAARMLLKLAIAENESWDNNATGVWVQTFQTRLGRTEAPWTVRVRVIYEAAEDEDDRARELAARAVQAGVQHGHVTRMGRPPNEVEGAPEEAWAPRTWGEWADAVIGYLDVLRRLVVDDSPKVRQAAVEALAEASVAAYVLPKVGPVWAEIARLLADAEYDLRAAVLERTQWAIQRGEAELDGLTPADQEETRGMLEDRLQILRDVTADLEGADFSSRFRVAVDRDPWRFAMDESDGGSWRDTALPLVQEAVSDPKLLEDEWQWLLGHGGSNPERLLEVFGEEDRERRLEERIRALAGEERRAIRWASLYDTGHARATDDDEFLEQRLQQLSGDPGGVGMALDLLLVAPPSESRIELLVGLFESGALGAEQVGRLQYTPMVRSLSPRQFSRVATAAGRSQDAGLTLLSLLSHVLYEHAEYTADLRDLSLGLLDDASVHEAMRRSDYEWAEVAKRYVDSDPIQVARSAFKWVEAQESSHLYGVDEIISRAIAASPDPESFFFDVVAEWLDHDDLTGWWVTALLPASQLQSISPSRLIEWIGERPEVRARKVARVLGAPMGERPSSLHNELLAHFDRDHGIGSVFFAELVSGVWTGSAAARSQGLLDQVKGWLSDDRSPIREWCEGAVRLLEAQLEHDEMRDEEDPFRF